MKTFKKFVPTIKARASPEDRPPEVTEAKKRWKEAAVDRRLLSQLIAVASDRTARAWESWQGVADQLTHMSGDGRGAEEAFFTNIADAQRQCADCLSLLRDVLSDQAVAMQKIDKSTSAPVAKAKQEFKKSEELLQKGKKDREKRLKAAGGGAEEDEDTAVRGLHNAMTAAASEYTETLEADRKVLISYNRSCTPCACRPDSLPLLF